MIHNKDSITMVFIGNLINTIDCWVMMRKTMHCNDEDVMMSKTATTWWQSFKKKRRSLTRTPLELSQLQPGLIVQLPIPYVSHSNTGAHSSTYYYTHYFTQWQTSAHCTLHTVWYTAQAVTVLSSIWTCPVLLWQLERVSRVVHSGHSAPGAQLNSTRE